MKVKNKVFVVMQAYLGELFECTVKKITSISNDSGPEATSTSQLILNEFDKIPLQTPVISNKVYFDNERLQLNYTILVVYISKNE
jgi:hypothetical protein